MQEIIPSTLPISLPGLISPNPIVVLGDDFTYLNSIWYVFLTITTIGFGKQVTGTKSIIGYDLNIGIRNISGLRRDLWKVPDQSGNLYTTALLNEVNKSQFFLSVSMKIGIYWNKK